MRTSPGIAPSEACLIGPGKLKVSNGWLSFAVPGQTPIRLRPEDLKSVVCFGDVSLSDEAIRVLARHQIQIAFMTGRGFRFHSRLVGSRDGTVQLRLKQYAVYENPKTRLAIARRVVEAKIQSQVAASRHLQRHGCREAGTTLRQLEQLRQKCQMVADADGLRGLEGAATAAGFQLYGRQFTLPWQFPGRRRRPPTDPINSLLSLGYTLLQQRTVAHLQAQGLEVYLGMFHEYVPGRPSLACDLMEPLRVPAVDRWGLAVVGQDIVRTDQFQPDSGGCRLQRDVFPTVLAKWEEHWLSDEFDKTLASEVVWLTEQLRSGAEPPEGISPSS